MPATFETRDLSLAAYLEFSGFSYTAMSIGDDGIVFWEFDRSPGLERKIVQFSSGDGYNEFARTYNSLRKRMRDFVDHKESR